MICCTGSNFLLRAAHAAEVGWFPTYTMVRRCPAECCGNLQSTSQLER